MWTSDFSRALSLLQRARVYPPNLGEGKLYGAQENNLLYYLACAHEGLGENEVAKANFESASTGLSEPTSAKYYNDQPPEMIFFQGLALQKLGRPQESTAVFQRLVDYANEHIDEEIHMDYFAVSLPDFLVFDKDLNKQNRQHCLFIRALGQTSQASQTFEQLLSAAPFHKCTILKNLLSGGAAHSKCTNP